MFTLMHSLQDHSLAMLRAIAERNDVLLRSNLTSAVVDQLATTLANRERLEAALTEFTPLARRAVDALQRSGGRSPVAAFERQFGVIRVFGPGRLEREAPQRAPVNASEELWYQGFIYRAFAQSDDGPAEFFYVPTDLVVLLPGPEPAAERLNLPAAPPSPVIQPANDRLLHDACTLLCFVQAGSVGLATAADPLSWRAGSLETLNGLLLRPDLGPGPPLAGEPGTPARLLLALARDSGWLRPQRYRLQLSPGPVLGWLEADRGQQRRLLLAAWQRSATWNDLCRTPNLHCEQTGSWTNEPIGTRQRLLPLLASLEAGTWYRLDDFQAGVKAHLPDFQRPDGDYDTWYVRRRGQQAYLRGFEHWDAVEGQLLHFLVAGPLHWLGAVDLGIEPEQLESQESRDPTAASFRLNAAGAAWLRDQPPPEEPAAATITVLPDFSVLVPDDAPLLDRFRLARFTTWEAGVPPFRYRITQSGLRRAKAQGIDSERVLDYLYQRAGDPLPPNVARALERWRAS